MDDDNVLTEEFAVYEVEPGFPVANLEAPEFMAGKDRMDIAFAVIRASTASRSLSSETENDRHTQKRCDCAEGPTSSKAKE